MSKISKLLEINNKVTLVSPLEQTAIGMVTQIEDTIEDLKNKLETADHPMLIKYLNKRIAIEKDNLKNAEIFLTAVQDYDKTK